MAAQAATEADAQALIRLIQARHSARAFLPRQVPLELQRRLFDLAGHAPSNCNVQPWSIHVVQSDALQRVGGALMEAAAAGTPPAPDYEGIINYPGIYRDRQVDTARQLYGAMGIDRADVEARNAALMRNFSFFDAPHAAFLFVPDWAKPREMADCGMYAQTLILLMTAFGIASCPQAALAQYPDIVRAELAIPASQRLLFGISFGYEDEAAAANSFRTGRIDGEGRTSFHS